MKIFSLILLIIILLWSIRMHGEDFEEYSTSKIEDVIDICVPYGFSMEEKILDDVIDFKVLFVKKLEKKYVGIYLGNHPQFPDQERPSVPNERKELITYENERILREEVLIKTPRKESWPMFIHAWIIDDLYDEEKLIGRQILKTISAKEGTETTEKFCEDVSGDWIRCSVQMPIRESCI